MWNVAMDIAAFGALCDMEIKQLETKCMMLINYMCQMSGGRLRQLC